MGRVFQAKTVERGAWMVSSLCQPRGALVTRPGMWTLPSGTEGRRRPADKGREHSGQAFLAEGLLMFAAWPRLANVS